MEDHLNVDMYLLRETKFSGNLNGHGGNRRTAQIAELIGKSSFLVEDTQTEISSTRLNRYCAGTRVMTKLGFEVPSSLRTVGLYGYYYLNQKHSFQRHKGPKVLLWEATDNCITPYIAKEFGFKVIALPHNLESLVAPEISSSTSHLSKKLEREIRHLAKADVIFCMSREEQWLLRFWGIEANFLPYYPPEAILANLQKIREARRSSEKQRFLVIGTAYNPPTRAGMVEQLQWLQRIREKVEFAVDVAGYGTEDLLEFCNHPDFTVLGTVDSDKLYHLMIEAKAVIVHQKAGAGSLTRIPEMLIAGIPVIANSNACRSTSDYTGIYCYDSEIELANLVEKSLHMPSIIDRPAAAENSFIHNLKVLV